MPAELLALIRADQSLRSLILPIKLDDKSLFLAMVRPLDVANIDNFSFRSDLGIVPCVTMASESQGAVINRHYFQAGPPAGKSDWWTVLVVDGQEMVRLAVVAALRKEGYLLLQAEKGGRNEGRPAGQRRHAQHTLSLSL